MAELLHPLTLPLAGSRLIEASAGTGKTWTIAALVLRLVLGHQAKGSGIEGSGSLAPLLPAEILVMTFTKAATRELTDRIRARLVEAAACFRGAAAPGDPFLAGLLDAYPPGAERDTAAWRLATAAEAMDDAAIFTIDAWCQRVLREHAFDSGCLFDEELQANEAAMLAEAARDVWRQQVYPLQPSALAAVLGLWSGVDALAASTRELLDKPLPPAAGQGSLQQCFDGITGQRSAALATAKAGCADNAAAMLAWLQGHWDSKDCALDKVKLQPARTTGWLATLRAWAEDADAHTLDIGTGSKRLTEAGITEVFKAGRAVPPPPCFAAFTALMQQLQALPEPAPLLRADMAARVRERLQQLKAQAGRFGFTDMLQRLHDALDEQLHGDRARRLRALVVQQCPVALVDEFQDTSPLQLGIFERLYRIAANDPAQALLLIGDPKQAIYGFRGADIHSYLQARRATAGRHHMLGTNHRSTAALVRVVNALFDGAEQRPGDGAFRFRNADGNELPFEPVAAQGRADRFVTAQGDEAAWTLCLDATLRKKDHARPLFAALCAERITTLLNDTQAGFVQDGEPHRRLRPADIAVLVRSGKEAAAVRQALRRRGVASVYLSDQDSVFRSAEAHDLLRLLQAVAAPRDIHLARAALATPLLGLALDELVALASDDTLFDARCLLLQDLHAAWQAQGVLAMLRRALHAFTLPARWLAGHAVDGERRLTNVLHLAELLQAASAQLDGEQALLRWLARQLADAATGNGRADDAQVLRLESDADLVQVVTVHKSKGLEYPLVFLPFAAFVGGGKPGRATWLPNPQGERQLSLQPGPDELEAAALDDQREDLRLLYVALTRARHALWVGAAALRSGRKPACVWHRSALGHLVSGDAPRSADAMAADVRALAAWPGVRVQAVAANEDHPDMPPPVPVTRLLPRDTPPPLQAALPYDASFDRQWSITSYSALVRSAGQGTTTDADDAATLADDASPDSNADGTPQRLRRDDEPAEAATAQPVSSAPWHRFPRGAFAGNVLHGLLEWLADDSFALDTSAPLQQALQRRCQRQGWGHRADDALQWLRLACSTPLPPLGVPLSALAGTLPEMEFWLPSDGLHTAAVDALCRRHILPGRPRPALTQRALRGMLMGFVDLVFEHGGRWWVLDYKSNALAGDDAGYTAAAMDTALLEHRYDVQAALYLLALQRLLRSRLGDAYNPAEQLGGALVWFLRGVAAPGAGCHHVAPPPGLLDGLQALLADGATALTGAST